MTPTPGPLFEFTVYGQSVRFRLPDPDDHIPRMIRQSRHFYEREMLEDIGRRLPEGALVVDVGANIGNHTVFFSRILGCPTISVEPNPVAASQLETNIELNGVGSLVEVHRIALGAGEGNGSVVNNDPGNLGKAQIRTGDSGKIRIRSLDDVVGARDVRLIKIDVEGMEPAVLSGAVRTIERCQPWLLVEAATGEHLRPVEGLLRPMGYRMKQVYNATPTYLFEHVSINSSPTVSTLPARDLAPLPRTTGIVAGMATVAGNELALRAAVMSLLPQIDRLYLYLNHFEEAPRFVRDNPKISWTVDTDGRRYGDAGKFWGLPQVRDSIYLTCDDDIVYPRDYAASMTRQLAALEGRAIVGVHGSIVLQPCGAHYEMRNRAVFHYEKSLMRRRQVHIVGSGTAAFHSSVVTMTLADFEYPNMADIWLAKFAQQKGLALYVVPRPDRWLTSLDVKRPTIYQQSTGRTGGEYDSSRHQDRVLSTLYPLSIGRTGTARRPAATVVVARTAEGLEDAIAAACAQDRDPIVIVLDDSADDDIRQTAHQVRFRCEIHVLRPADSVASREVIKSILASASTVRCLELTPGSSEQLATEAWRGLLGRTPRTPVEVDLPAVM